MLLTLLMVLLPKEIPGAVDDEEDDQLLGELLPCPLLFIEQHLRSRVECPRQFRIETVHDGLTMLGGHKAAAF